MANQKSIDDGQAELIERVIKVRQRHCLWGDADNVHDTGGNNSGICDDCWKKYELVRHYTKEGYEAWIRVRRSK